MGSRFVSAALSDAGNVRGNNEDRVYVDAERGIYLVVDGMGGQAAGEEAAEIAVKTIRSRLERPTDRAEQRVREAIALANNAIFEAARNNPEWRGMACVLTLALIENGQAVLGHVGDSRAYKILGGKIQKVTRDHSPIGEREDAGELTEEAAMKHPRRNEVFRDVGSTPRTPDDADFIDIERVPVPDDAALLLCSDGLSDVVPARRILQVVEEYAGDCEAALRTLVRAAVADGKDNVSIVLVEGANFASKAKPVDRLQTKPPLDNAKRAGRPALAFIAGLLLAFIVWAAFTLLHPAPAPAHVAKTLHVGSGVGEYPTLPEAINAAEAGDTIDVGPGKYPEKVALRPGLTIRAMPAREAILTGGLVADAIQQGALRDLSIGDAGLEVNNSNLQLSGLHSTGPIRFTGDSKGSLHGSRVASILVEDAASPEIGVNFIAGDLDFGSTGELRLENNALQGILFVPAPLPPARSADLLKHNLFSAKKPIQIERDDP